MHMRAVKVKLEIDNFNFNKNRRKDIIFIHDTFKI